MDFFGKSKMNGLVRKKNNKTILLTATQLSIIRSLWSSQVNSIKLNWYRPGNQKTQKSRKEAQKKHAFCFS